MCDSYKAIHYVQLPDLKEFILIAKICEENKKILESINKVNKIDEGLLFVFFGTIEGQETELPEMVREMIADMVKNGVNVWRYILAEFKDSAEMDEYINKMRKVEKTAESEILKIQEIIKAEKEKQEKIINSEMICGNE